MAVLDYQTDLDRQSDASALSDRRRHSSAPDTSHPVFALQQQAGNQAVQRLLRTSASPHSAATTPAHAQAYIGPQLNDAINEIKRELDHLVYTDNVEDRVLKILSRWSEDNLKTGSLDMIFFALQTPKSGVFSDTTYYDAMLDRFDRADEVRALRDSTWRYRGKESAKVTKQHKKETEERAEKEKEAAIHDDTAPRAVDVEEYDLPPTPENLTLAKREIDRLSRTPDEKLTVLERRQSVLLRDAGYDPKVLLRKWHTVTAYERSERQKERLRALARPLLEMLLWTTAERLAVLAIEAVVARLFAAEARSAALVLSEGEAGLGAIAGEGAPERLVAPGPTIAREGYTFHIQSMNPVTGDVIAVGRDLKTGEIATVEINIDTGVGLATKANGETISIRQGRLDFGSGTSATAKTAGEAKAGVPAFASEPVQPLFAQTATDKIAADIEEELMADTGTAPTSAGLLPPPATSEIRTFHAALEKVDLKGMPSALNQRLEQSWEKYLLNPNRRLHTLDDYKRFVYGKISGQIPASLRLPGAGLSFEAQISISAGLDAEKIQSQLRNTVKNTSAYPVTFYDPIRKITVAKTVIPDFMPAPRIDATGRFLSASNPTEAVVIADSKVTWEEGKNVANDDQIRAMIVLAKENGKPFVFLLKQGGDISSGIRAFAAAVHAEIYVVRDASGLIK